MRSKCGEGLLSLPSVPVLCSSVSFSVHVHGLPNKDRRICVNLRPQTYYLTANTSHQHMENITSNRRGLLALSPLLVFLCVYLVSSIIANDFYKIPISAAFLISSVYAIIICRGKSLEDRVKVFSKGAGNSNVLLMIWIFKLCKLL